MSTNFLQIHTNACQEKKSDFWFRLSDLALFFYMLGKIHGETV